MIPCIRVQEGRGGSLPDPGYAGNVAWSILQYKIDHPEYADRLLYLQLWNEPHDPRDKVAPDAYADYLVAAHSAVHQAESEAAAAHPDLGLEGTSKTMTPGQNGPSWWQEAFSHNPDAKFAFDVWGTHPYPEATPPQYNLHDGDVFIETSITVDSYLMDLDVAAMPHGNPPRSRRGFPVMITETAYGNKLGVSYEGWPKTSRQMAADYSVDAYGNRWYRWPEIIAVHPFILSNWAWRDFEWIDSTSWQDTDGDGIDETYSPYPQFSAVRQLRLDLEAQGMAPARLTPYRGARGTIKGIIQHSDTGEPVPYATIFTDGYEFGHASLFDGGYEIHDVPEGAYTLAVEKNGYVSTSKQITVVDRQTTTADFNLVYSGKVSRGIYFVDTFAGHSGCSGCDLFAGFLGQTFTVPADVGFIKYAACKPNIDNVTLKFSILEGGPFGNQVGSPTIATLEPGDGAIMIGAEWPDGHEPSVTPGNTYFLKVERADGQGIYCFASDANPYADGNAFVAGTSHPGWDLYAVIRGLTLARNLARGNIAGTVSSMGSDPIGQALIAATPGGYTTSSDDEGRYGLGNLPTGTYSVSACQNGYTTQTHPGIVVNAGITTFVDFELAQTQNGSVAGTVQSAAGNPIADALLRLTPGDYQTRTAADGSYLLPEVSPGTYSLAATKAGFHEGIQSDVIVHSGETTTVDVSLQPAPIVMPRIENPDFEADGGFFGVADGWFPFGGNKWESVWDPQRVFTQGIADISPGESGGIYQKIQLTPGASYRLSADGKTSTQNYAVAIGVDPDGGIDPDYAIWGDGSTSAAWTQLTVEFLADASEVTLFLNAQNSGSWSYGNWAQFDGVRIELLESDNHPPTAVAAANPTLGNAPLTVQFDGSASHDPDGDTLTYEWDFGDGATRQSGAMATHIFTNAGAYGVILTVDDSKGGRHSDTVTITIEDKDLPSNSIVNGDFSEGLSGWSIWIERGSLNPEVTAAGQLQVQSSDHNGGLYQQFQTGGAGTDISISGFWATDSSDPDGDQLLFSWDFGDGTLGEGPNTSHTYQEPGTYAITLLADDGHMGTATDVLSILVTDPASTSGPSKLTIHTSFLGPASWEFIEQAQPAVVKILDEIKVEVTQGVKNKSPHTQIVGRIWYDARQRLGDGDPEARAFEWWENLKGTILANPAVDYWEGYNEPVIHDAALMQWYAAFEKRRIEVLAAHGRRACIGNFSTGMPPAEREVWEAFYPAIDAALANGGVLGLHEYSARDMDWLFDHGTGEGWLTGRYRKVYRQFLIPDGRIIPLVITECGIDGGVLGIPDDINRGWRSYQSAENYFDQLKWYDSLLKEDSYVLGATIFSLEIHNWGDFDISGEVFELLTDYARSSRLPAQ